eukprot:gene12246-8432_t
MVWCACRGKEEIPEPSTFGLGKTRIAVVPFLVDYVGARSL